VIKYVIVDIVGYTDGHTGTEDQDLRTLIMKSMIAHILYEMEIKSKIIHRNCKVHQKWDTKFVEIKHWHS